MENKKKGSCEVSCSPSDYYPGGKCDLNGCLDKRDFCVNCQHPLNSDFEITQTDQVPHPGDFTICLYCGQPYWYDQDLKKFPIPRATFDKMPFNEKEIIRSAWKVRAELIRAAQESIKPGG